MAQLEAVKRRGKVWNDASKIFNLRNVLYGLKLAPRAEGTPQVQGQLINSSCRKPSAGPSSGNQFSSFCIQRFTFNPWLVSAFCRLRRHSDVTCGQQTKRKWITRGFCSSRLQFVLVPNECEYLEFRIFESRKLQIDIQPKMRQLPSVIES